MILGSVLIGIHQLSTWLVFSVLMAHRTHKEHEEARALPPRSSRTELKFNMLW